MLINVQEQVETVKQLFKKEQIALQVVFDQDGKVSKDYYVSNHPIKFLIDGQGNMIAVGFGYRDWDSEEMNKLVNILIQQAGETPKA